jgi:CBS domain containing-hemolysin-like protein
LNNDGQSIGPEARAHHLVQHGLSQSTPQATEILSPISFDVSGIIVCLFGSAFFSGSETALTSLSQPQIQQLIEEEGATALRLWRDKPIQVLTAILIGNNLFNVAASALATDLANRLFDQGAVAIATGGMTFLLLTFGEITPKSVAKQWSTRLSTTIMSAMRVPYFIFYPATLLFTKMTRTFMTMLGDDPDQHFSYVTAEELEYLVDLGSREGSFSEERERLLRSVFEFPDTLVREVMVPRTEMVAISVDMELATIVDILVDCGHSRIPVYEDNVDEIQGLFYAKDLIRMVDTDPDQNFDIQEFIREPYFVPESKGIAELLSEFQAERMHMAIVVDEFGGTAGLITLEDIIEEFFGDIQDEYDSERPQIIRVDPHRARADARIPIDEIEQFCGLDLPEHPDYESLGGFLMAQSGTVPEVGNEIDWEHIVFRVLKADAKSVQTVELETVEEPWEKLGFEESSARSETNGEDDDEDEPEVREMVS